MQLSVIFSRESKSCSEPLALSWKKWKPKPGVRDRDQILGKKMSRMLELSQAKTYGTYHDQTSAGKNLKKDIGDGMILCFYYPSWSPEQLLVVYQHGNESLCTAEAVGQCKCEVFWSNFYICFINTSKYFKVKQWGKSKN